MSRRWFRVLIVSCAVCSLAFKFEWPEWPGAKKKPASMVSRRDAESAREESEPGSSADESDSATLEKTPGGGKRAITPASRIAPIDEFQRIQEDLRKISAQTKIIKTRSYDDRVQLQKVIQQTKIQRKLLDSVKLPQPVPKRVMAKPDEVLRQAKIRLIAEDVRKTQQTLDNIRIARQSSVNRTQPARVD